MPWPLSQDYNEALQNLQSSFNDPELRQGQVVVNALAIPQPCSGNFADVYAVASADGKTKWAVKCFTREVHGLRERYSEISDYLQKVRLPFTVDFQYLEQGIRIAGRWYPILKMHWVEGFTLNAFVRDMLDKPAMLEKLSRIWVRMAHRLREAKLTHCDLQHGNVLLVPDSEAHALAVKLIDYDGMWVPNLATTPSGEFGHPAYQHPRRLHDNIYNAEVDRFPLLSVHVALRALIVGGRKIWERYDTGDNLLFRKTDFEAPAKSPLFAELLRMNHPELRDSVVKLIDAARMPLEQTPHLADLVAEEKPPRPSVAKTQSPPVLRQPAAQAREANPFQDLAAGKAARDRNGSLLPWIATGVVAACALVGGVLLWGLQAGGSSEKPAAQPALAHAKNEATTPAPKDQKPPAPKEGQPPVQVDKKDLPPEKRSQTSNPSPPPDKSASAPPKQKPLSLPADASIADLRRALKSEDPALREVAAARLANLGTSAEPALDDLAAALSDEKNTVRVRRNAALALAHMGPVAKRAVPALAKALSRMQPLDVRQSAAEALAKITYPANEPALPAILDALDKDRDPSVRQRCLWALFGLQEIKTNGVDKILVKILETTKPEMLFERYDAARMLARLLRDEAPDKTADVLLEMLKNKTIKVHNGTDIKVEDTDKTVTGGRTNVQANLAGDARFYAAEALVWLGKKASRRKDIMDALKTATTDSDPKLREAAAAALKSLGAQDSAAATAAAATRQQPPNAGKLPVPDEAVQKKTIEDIRDIYKADYDATVRGADERVALAVKLLKRGTNKGEEPERRFAYLREARDQAARGGDVELCLRAIDELAKMFAVELVAMKTAALELAAKAPQSPESAKKLFGETLTVYDEAESADDYEHAAKLLKIAQTAVYKSGDTSLRGAVAHRENRLKLLRAEYAKITEDFKTLADKPNDAAANLAVGKFRCFVKEDWNKGLPMLTQSQDTALVELARKDMDNPQRADEQAALGQAWKTFAEKQGNANIKKAAQQRAKHWLCAALPQLDGVEADRIASQLEMKVGRLKLRPGLIAELFGDENFGKRIKARLDYKINYAWAFGKPDEKVPADHFSIRWQGVLIPPRAGKYKFTVTADDGARLFVDGQSVIDFWGANRLETQSKEVELAGKPHLLRLEYHEVEGDTTIRLDWSLEGGFAEQPISLDALYHDVKQERLLAP